MGKVLLLKAGYSAAWNCTSNKKSAQIEASVHNIVSCCVALTLCDVHAKLTVSPTNCAICNASTCKIQGYHLDVSRRVGWVRTRMPTAGCAACCCCWWLSPGHAAARARLVRDGRDPNRFPGCLRLLSRPRGCGCWQEALLSVVVLDAAMKRWP
jgi:hypothetical protein